MLDPIPLQEREKKNLTLSNNKDSIKALGLIWCPQTHDFHISTPCQNSSLNQKITKRCILATIASIFGPLGLVAPVTTSAKVLLQELWKLKCFWDESLPRETRSSSLEFINDLSHLKTLSIPRRIFPLDEQQGIELHEFADASIKPTGPYVTLLLRIAKEIKLQH